MEPDYKYIVTTHCATYNHSAYIEDAMNGFCMQKTSFPYICVIIDDASTDGEQEVISDYMNDYFDLDNTKVAQKEDNDDFFMLFAQHKKNFNCFFAVYFLKCNHYQAKKSKNK